MRFFEAHSSTNSVARTFDRVCDVLSELGYLEDGDQGVRVTRHGARLRRLYTEHDLLASECLREGVWAGLDGPALAACLSALVHESRREEGPPPRLPSPFLPSALADFPGAPSTIFAAGCVFHQ